MTNNQRKETFSEVKQRITREEFVGKLQELGRDETIKFFELGLTNFGSLVHFYECENILKEQAKQKRKASYELKAKQKLDALVKLVSKEEFNEFYINQNHSYQETAKHFNITETQFFQLVDYYNCRKPKTVSTKISAETKQEKYGSSTYNNREQSIKTCYEKYGVSNPAQVTSFMNAAHETKVEHYGMDNCNNWIKNHETRIQNSGSLEESYIITTQHRQQTLLEEYGVDNAAKLDFVKDKIRSSTEQTFMEKYGVPCYWLTNDAKRSNGSKDSSYNIAFAQLLTNSHISFEREVTVGRFIYDFKVGNYLIEVNPSPTHNITWSPYSEQGIDKDYHKNKSKNAIDKGYRCIHVWDWDNKDALIEQLLLPKIRLFARKCQIREVTLQETKEFINRHHLQGYAKDSIRIGLYYDNVLVSIMTFGKPRYNLTAEYELIRYCSWCTVIGGADKLFKYFVDTYSPKSVVSYCDTSKFKGDVYTKLGFEYRGTTLSHHWYNLKTKQHILDSLLRKRGFDQIFNTSFGKGTSNHDLMTQHGFIEVVDSGQSTYMWKKSLTI